MLGEASGKKENIFDSSRRRMTTISLWRSTKNAWKIHNGTDGKTTVGGI
jgi:hypothetical protein